MCSHTLPHAKVFNIDSEYAVQCLFLPYARYSFAVDSRTPIELLLCIYGQNPYFERYLFILIESITDSILIVDELVENICAECLDMAEYGSLQYERCCTPRELLRDAILRSKEFREGLFRTFWSIDGDMVEALEAVIRKILEVHFLVSESYRQLVEVYA